MKFEVKQDDNGCIDVYADEIRPGARLGTVYEDACDRNGIDPAALAQGIAKLATEMSERATLPKVYVNGYTYIVYQDKAVSYHANGKLCLDPDPNSTACFDDKSFDNLQLHGPARIAKLKEIGLDSDGKAIKDDGVKVWVGDGYENIENMGTYFPFIEIAGVQYRLEDFEKWLTPSRAAITPSKNPNWFRPATPAEKAELLAKYPLPVAESKPVESNGINPTRYAARENPATWSCVQISGPKPNRNASSYRKDEFPDAQQRAESDARDLNTAKLWKVRKEVNAAGETTAWTAYNAESHVVMQPANDITLDECRVMVETLCMARNGEMA